MAEWSITTARRRRLAEARRLRDEAQLLDQIPHIDTRDDTWRTHRVCAGLPLSVFFGDSDGRNVHRQARRICDQCPVRAPCLANWLAHVTAVEDHGYVGGTTADQRTTLRRELAARGQATRRSAA